jgi:hypothetical protein
MGKRRRKVKEKHDGLNLLYYIFCVRCITCLLFSPRKLYCQYKIKAKGVPMLAAHHLNLRELIEFWRNFGGYYMLQCFFFGKAVVSIS